MPEIYQQIIGLIAFNQACQSDIVSVLYNGPFLIPEIQSLLSMPAIYQLGLDKVQKAEFFPVSTFLTIGARNKREPFIVWYNQGSKNRKSKKIIYMCYFYNIHLMHQRSKRVSHSPSIHHRSKMPISSRSPENGETILNIFLGIHLHMQIFTWILKDIHLDVKWKIFNRNVARRFEHAMTQPGHLDDVNENWTWW